MTPAAAVLAGAVRAYQLTLRPIIRANCRYEPSVSGSISLLGGRIDDLVLRDYRETIDPSSPLVRLLEPRADPQPYFVQFGWTAGEGEKIAVPGDDTLWTGSGALSATHPVTLSWDNGQGQVFEIV